MALRAESSREDRPSALEIVRALPAATPAARDERPPRRRLSLQARMLLAASVVLFGFLGLAGFALDQAFYESSLKELSYRLRSLVFAYLRDTDVSISGKLLPPEFPPDSRFDRPQSGLYAVMIADDARWDSASALGHKLAFDASLAAGKERFQGPLETTLGPLYVYTMGVLLPWSDRGEPKEMLVNIHVAEDGNELEAQLGVYRRTLWTWLAGLGVVLLLVLVLVLRWSLRPLRRVVRDLARVERGEAERLPGGYPRELEGLTQNVNDFIESEREQRARYRNTLSDLAHSLKTPLAVLRSELESDDEGAAREAVTTQVARMDEIVAYQLSRAVTSGRQRFAVPVTIEEPAEAIVRSLEKVYADRQVLCEFDIDPQARFYGEEGDLLELLGNLLENAFKWAAHHVELSARKLGPIGARRPGLELVVEDDGPGIPEDQVERLLQRGVRGDERVRGHGIGLSIVQDIVKAYRAEFSVTRSALGGASFALRFPPTP